MIARVALNKQMPQILNSPAGEVKDFAKVSAQPNACACAMLTFVFEMLPRLWRGPI